MMTGRSFQILSTMLVMILFGGVLYAPPLPAAKTQRFVTMTFADFRRGDSTTSTLSDEGYVTLPPTSSSLYAPERTEVFWDAVRAADGKIHLGSGHSGKVFSLDRESSGSLHCLMDELQVQALALHPDGSLLAGGGPGGKVWKITRQDERSLFYDTGEQYVWAISVVPSGDIFIATGTNGKIFRADAQGKGELYCTLPQAKNVLTLGFDAKGRLLAGTQEKGMLVRIEEKDKPFVVHEPGQDEVRRIVVAADGWIWMAANGKRSAGMMDDPRSGAAARARAASLGSIISSTANSEEAPPEEEEPPMPPPRMAMPGAPGATVYLINPDGYVELTWSSPEAPIQDILEDGRGQGLFVAAGNGGALYRVDRLGRYQKLLSVREKGIMRLAACENGDLLALTNAPAVAYRIQPSRPAQGIYVSQAFDAQSAVRWGRARLFGRFPQGSSMLFSTRSGNTADPEKYWSDWSKEVAVAAAGEELPVASPNARRIQFRLRMTAASEEEPQWPRVQEVQIPYIAPNQAPRIREVSVKPPPPSARRSMPGGPPMQSMQTSDDESGAPEEMMIKLPGGPGGGSRGGGEGGPARPDQLDTPPESNPRQMVVTWSASDPNRDELRSRVHVRSDQELHWVLLEENIKGSRYMLDTSALPDGRFRIKVEVDDSPANLPTDTLSAFAVSDAFVVDNTPPSIAGLSSGAGRQGVVRIVFEAQDAVSVLGSAQWRLNTRPWQFLLPEDGLFDSRSERFVFEIPAEEFKGEATAMLTVRVTDERGNTTVAQKRIEAKP